jgi:hypothetical protein
MSVANEVTAGIRLAQWLTRQPARYHAGNPSSEQVKEQEQLGVV